MTNAPEDGLRTLEELHGFQVDRHGRLTGESEWSVDLLAKRRRCDVGRCNGDSCCRYRSAGVGRLALNPTNPALIVKG
jgi:hypothetical protein